MQESNVVKIDSNLKGLVLEAGKTVNLTASGQIKASAGKLIGAVINSHSSGTIKIWDNTAGSGTVLFNTITLAVGERNINFFGAYAGTGLYATLTGTIDVTFIYQ